MNLLIPTTEMGRVLPTADVGCPVAQLGGQLSGGEFGGVAVSTRPNRALRCAELEAGKRPVVQARSPGA